ncbi:MAG TPA: hypothetical protein VGC27_08650, partial [Rhizomicrobium sp.]
MATASPAYSLPQIEAFGQLPTISSAKLSPDGMHLAAIQSQNGRPVVTIYDLGAAPGTPPVILPYEEKDGHIVSIMWVKKDRLFITININFKDEDGRKVNSWYRTQSV